MDANSPYEWTTDLPEQMRPVAFANALDGDGQAIVRATDLRDVDQWVRDTETPVGAEARFGRAIR